LAYLDIFDNFIFGEGECDAVVQIIDRILGTMSSESVGVKQAQMLVYRAIMNGKMGERLGSIDLLDASARDYQKVRDALDKLAEEGQPDMQKTLAQARLGAANIAMVRAEHLKDPKAVLEQRQEAVRLYKEANESAQACGDRLLQVSIFGELSHALALLQEWKDAEQAYSNALEILDELEVENPNAYANDRAWVFVTAGDTHLRKGLKLNDQVEFEKGYTKAEEAIELLQHIALGKFDISLLDAHITAADCAWAESKRLKGAPASSARARAEAHWKSAHEIARQLGEEDIVAEQSIFYNRR
jgi:tetratricopeptide (TPR) repeat protein